jgi:hypothetical protein
VLVPGRLHGGVEFPDSPLFVGLVLRLG